MYFAPTRPMFELYDLQSDPAEMHNLNGRPEAAALERELKAQLEVWMIAEHDFAPLPFPGPAKRKKAGKQPRRAAQAAKSSTKAGDTP
jgi:hypothetical protein